MAALQKKTLNFREGDWDYLESLFYQQGLGPSVVIRTLVSNYVDAQRKKEQKTIEDGTLNIHI